jgi:N-dimethylarginine dimethylaminohydrolase
MRKHNTKYAEFNQQSAEQFHAFAPQSWKNFLSGDKESILMIPPAGIIISDKWKNSKEQEYHAFYKQNPEAFRNTACKQWQSLVDLYNEWDVKVVIGEHTPGMGDQVYTADNAGTMRYKAEKKISALTSFYSAASRQPEVQPFMALLKTEADAMGYTVSEHQMKHNFEGTGDCYYDSFRDVMFAGFTTDPDSDDPAKGRSALESHQELEEQTGIETISLEVVKPCFHIDTCLAPLPSGHMLVYKEGMTAESYEHLIQKAFIEKGLDHREYLIPVSKNDAENHFATNMLCVGNKIAMPQFEDEIDGHTYDPIEPALLKRLADIGYDVTVLNYSHMIMAGGAMHCTSHMIPTRVKGGVIAQMINGLNEIKIDPALAGQEKALQSVEL